MRSDLATIEKASLMARENEQKTLNEIASTRGGGGPAAACVNRLPAGTDLATLSKTDDCWVDYLRFLDTVSAASGVNIRGMVDPWGRPYWIEVAETRATSCTSDSLWVYGENFGGWGSRYPNMSRRLPLSGFNPNC